MDRRFFPGFVVLLAACGGETPPPSVPPVTTVATPSAAIIAYRDIRIIDGTGAAPIEHGVLVIEGKTIRAVAANAEIPSGATVIDGTNLSVMPGLVTDHAHVGMTDGTAGNDGHYTRENILRQLGQWEAYGVTTVTSLGMNGQLFYELQPALHRGELPGADLFGADRGIGVPAAAPPMDVGPDRLYRPVDAAQARIAVRESAARHPSFIKIWVDDFNGSLKVKMAPDVYAAIIDEAHQQHVRVAAHVYYLEDAKRLVNDGVDVLAHGVRDQAVDADFITALKGHHTWYVPTIGLDEAFYVYAEAPEWTNAPFFRHALQPALAAQLDDPAWRRKTLADPKLPIWKKSVATNEKNVKTLYDAGVAIGFGTDAGATPLRIPGFAEHRELRLLVDAGLSPIQAIHVATQSAAELLGENDRGVLAPGKLADLIVVSGNPAGAIEATDNIVTVWHRGVRIDPMP